MTKQNNTRRQFLKTTIAAGAAATTPYFFSRSKTLASTIGCKNDRIPIGVIGAGGMGVGNMQAAKDWVDVVAIADVDGSRRDAANNG